MSSETTHPSLLLRIRDDRDHQAWSRFVETYAPLIYGFVRKHGLQDADAADVTQDVLTSVSSAIKLFEYDPQRGTFRSWLFTVVQNRLTDFGRRAGRGMQAAGDSAQHTVIAQHPDSSPDLLDTWERDYERQLFQSAARQVQSDFQESTWQAFWMTAVEGKSGKDAARELGLTVAAVYLCRRRVTARIKEQIHVLQGEGKL